MKKIAYRTGRIQVQGTLRIDVFSHVKYRETLARTWFWAVLWRLAKFSRLLAQPLCWKDKTRSFRNASSRSEIPFFLQKVWSSVRMPLANSFSHLYSKFAFFLKQLDFNCPWACQMNYFFAEVRKSGVHQTPTLHKGKRDFEWVFVDESPPPSLKTLVMLQSDPTRIPTELIRIDVR